MTTIINASNTTGLTMTSDLTGTLSLQSAGTAVANISSTGFSTPNNINVPNTFGYKNRIINGNMTIDQRNAGANATGTGYTVDRWQYSASQVSKFTYGQNLNSVTPPAGFKNYLGFQSSSSYSVTSTDYFNINQIIEGLNILDLAWGTADAKTVTLSFWVRSSLTGTFGGSLGNNGFTYAYPFSYSIPVANTWTQVSITISGPTSGTWLTTNGRGVYVLFGLGYGATYGNGTAGAWVAADLESVTGATSVVGTNGATFYITGVQLEVGSQATSFDFRDYGRELQMCQRYYQKIAPPNATMINTGQAYASTGVIYGWPLVVWMRATPTLNYSGLATWDASGTSQTLTGLTLDSGSGAVVRFLGTVASGLVAGSASGMHTVGSTAYISFTAEL